MDSRRDSYTGKHIETDNYAGHTSAFHNELFAEHTGDKTHFHRHRGTAENSYYGDQLRPLYPNEEIEALADYIVLFASSDRTNATFALHGRIANLTNREQFRLFDELSQRAKAVPGYYEKRIAPIGQIDTQTGDLMDLDLIVFDSDTPKIIDIYTPGEKGENCDQEQEMHEAIAKFPDLSTERVWQCEKYPAARK
jgi:hypothetical protein